MAIITTSSELTARPRAGWDDMVGSATAINPPGAESDPDYDTTKGGWLFAAAATETLIIIDQINHQWVEGTELRPHVHWEKTTSAAGAVYWRLQYQISAHEQARTELATLFSTTPATDTDVADTQLITPLGAIALSGYNVSTILIAWLSRVGGEAADTYEADARLLSFDYHIQKDFMGSQTEWVKDSLE